MNDTPRIAVVLPVFNGEKFITEAVASVLAQTFVDFELFVIDDGSTDRSVEALSGFSDPRLRVLRFPANRGLVAALNHGIRESRSELIARMDADDVCLPRRFERQVAFLDAHPEVEVCGTWTEQFGNDRGTFAPPEEPARVRARLFFGSAMDHPTIMIRRAFLERNALAYDDEFKHVEDYDFFLRASEKGSLANLPEVLLRARAHAGEVSVVHSAEQAGTEARLRLRVLRSLLPDATGDEEAFHVRMLFERIDPSDHPKAVRWLRKLEQANLQVGLYEPEIFRKELLQQFDELHVQAAWAGRNVLRSFWNSPFEDAQMPRIRTLAGLAGKMIYGRLRRAIRV